MGLTIDVLQPQANIHVLQLSAIAACFLLSVFSQVNSQSCAIVEEDGEKNYQLFSRKQKTIS